MFSKPRQNIDVILVILKKLPAKNISAFMQTSRELRTLAKYDEVWQTFGANNFDDFVERFLLLTPKERKMILENQCSLIEAESKLFEIYINREISIMSIDYFTQINIDNIESFKNKINDLFLGKNKAVISTLKEACYFCEKFIVNIQENPLNYKSQHVMSNRNGEYSLLPLFAWVAMNNKSDLLNNDFYKKLIITFYKASYHATIIAAIFGANDYVKKSISLLGLFLIKPVIIIAILNHDNDLLNAMIHLLKDNNVTYSKLPEIPGEYSDYEAHNLLANCFPLHAAIRSNNLYALNYLLTHDVPDDLLHLGNEDTSALGLAIRSQQPSAVECLLAHGADPFATTFIDSPALHEAVQYQEWDTACLIASLRPGTLEITDEHNRKPLDYVDDPLIVKRIRESAQGLIQEENGSPRSPGLFSTKPAKSEESTAQKSEPKKRI